MNAEKQPLAVLSKTEETVLGSALSDALRDHRLANQQTEQGDQFPLIDALTPDGETVAIGNEEIDLLADQLFGNVSELFTTFIQARSEKFGDPVGSFDKCMQAMDDRDAEARKVDTLTRLLSGLVEAAGAVTEPSEALRAQLQAVKASGLL